MSCLVVRYEGYVFPLQSGRLFSVACLHLALGVVDAVSEIYAGPKDLRI